MNDID